LVAGLILSATACVIAVVDRSNEGQSRPIQSQYHRALEMKPGGVLILENTDGDIEISGWAEEKVDIAASRRRDLPPSGGIYFLGKRFSPPDIRTERTGDSVEIKTEEKRDKEGGDIVHYALKVPRSIRIDSLSNGRGNIRIADVYGKAVIAAKEGRVEVMNYSGTLDIRLGNGNIEAELLDLRPEDSIRIEVERGDIVIYLEPGISARFSLEAPAGTISSEIDLNQPVPSRKVSSTTGEGGASFELTALQGDINIRKVEGSP
jgi:hypothetical protein